MPGSIAFALSNSWREGTKGFFSTSLLTICITRSLLAAMSSSAGECRRGTPVPI